MTIDHATNLPALPAGYFWRVVLRTREYTRYKYYEVQLRKKCILGSLLEYSMSCHIDGYHESINRKNIKAAAEQVLMSREGENAALNLTGDYPPKRL